MYNNGNSSKNVTGASVVDGTLENADFADNTISGDKIDGGTISGSVTLVTPDIGTPSAGTLTNCSGTASSLTSGNVTTNANLTGVVTSSGNATAIADNAISGDKIDAGIISNFQSTGIDDRLPTGKVLTLKDKAAGIGVTPNAWSASYTALDMGDAFGGGIAVRNAASSPQSQAWVTSNTYRSNDSTTDTSGWTAKAGHLCAALGIGLQGGSALKFMTSGWTAAGAVVSFTEKVTMDGDGLKFNGDTAAANALDDYEEGTFTATFWSAIGGGGSNIGSGVGNYTKIGAVVNISFRRLGGSGNCFSFTGLPFATADDRTSGVTADSVHIYIDGGATTLNYRGAGDNTVSRGTIAYQI